MIFFSKGEPDKEWLNELNKATKDWEMSAARNECGWICSSCGADYPSGMPDKCHGGNKGCNEQLKLVKEEAYNGVK